MEAVMVVSETAAGNYYILSKVCKRSAIAEKARVFFVNPCHGTVENPILDANNVDFYGTTTFWCPRLNSEVGRYGSQP